MILGKVLFQVDFGREFRRIAFRQLNVGFVMHLLRGSEPDWMRRFAVGVRHLKWRGCCGNLAVGPVWKIFSGIGVREMKGLLDLFWRSRRHFTHIAGETRGIGDSLYEILPARLWKTAERHADDYFRIVAADLIVDFSFESSGIAQFGMNDELFGGLAWRILRCRCK